MRLFARAFCLLMFLGVCTFRAHAIQVTVLYDGGPCTDVSATGVGGSSGDPLDVVWPPTDLCFENTGATTMTMMYVEYQDVPDGTIIQCYTNIWAECGEDGSSTPGGLPDTFDQLYEYFGTGAPNMPQECLNLDDQPYLAAVGCAGLGYEGNGVIPDNGTIIATPEPASIVLLSIGLIAVFLVTRRRRFDEAMLV